MNILTFLGISINHNVMIENELVEILWEFLKLNSVKMGISEIKCKMWEEKEEPETRRWIEPIYLFESAAQNGKF